MRTRLRLRRIVLVCVVLMGAFMYVSTNPDFRQETPVPPVPTEISPTERRAAIILETLAVKGKAAKTGYSREQFGGVWNAIDGTCGARDVILHRDLTKVVLNANCQVVTGVLNDPYTGNTISFVRGPGTSSKVQIDHVVAIGNAWVTGAQTLTLAERKALYVDPLELLAVDGQANNNKGDGDAATWLPPNKAFRCQYVARQIAVKAKYTLWVTAAEKQAMLNILQTCPEQLVPNGALEKVNS